MVDFMNKLNLNDQKYQTDGNVRDKNYNRRLLFTMKYLVSFGKDHQSMYFMSTRLLNDNINAVRVPQFQHDYICYTTNPSSKKLV